MAAVNLESESWETYCVIPVGLELVIVIILLAVLGMPCSLLVLLPGSNPSLRSLPNVLFGPPILGHTSTSTVDCMALASRIYVWQAVIEK